MFYVLMSSGLKPLDVTGIMCRKCTSQSHQEQKGWKSEALYIRNQSVEKMLQEEMGIQNSKRCKAMKMTETGNTMP